MASIPGGNGEDYMDFIGRKIDRFQITAKSGENGVGDIKIFLWIPKDLLEIVCEK